jgi:fibronectin-binding autotransporter adhesin
MSDLTQPNSRKRGASSLAYRLLCSASIVSGLMALGASAAHGSDRHWDANGTAVSTGGTETWNLAGLNWSPSGDGVSGPYSTWDNAALDNAIFGGAGGTVTLGLPITVQNLTFGSAYTLTGSTLTLGGTTPTIATTHGINVTTTINSTIAGAAGLTKAGNGSLRLTGTNSFNGTISLLSGRLSAASDASLGAVSNNILTANGVGVTLRIDGASTARAGCPSGTGPRWAMIPTATLAERPSTVSTEWLITTSHPLVILEK